jgi:hypothetical protein
MFADVVGVITHRRYNATATRMAQLQEEIGALQHQMENLSILHAHDASRDDGGEVDDTWTDADAQWARDRRALLEPRQHPSSSGGSSDPSDSNANISLWDGEGDEGAVLHGTSSGTPLSREVTNHADATATAWWRTIYERLQIASAIHNFSNVDGSAKCGGASATEALSALGNGAVDVSPSPVLPHDAFMEARLHLWKSRVI